MSKLYFMNEFLSKIAKYNFWNGNSPDLGYLREDYQKKIQSFSGNKLVKVLMGQRRSGKSYILRQTMAAFIQAGTAPQNIFYINKEFVEYDFLTDYNALISLTEIYKAELKPVGKIYLFIDEVQNIEGWERYVNSFSQDFVDLYEIFITGSNSQMLSGELATLLSGRYIPINIYPFSFSEYCNIVQKEQSKQTYLDFLQTGALPELFHLNEHETKRNYVSAVKDTVLLRDIIQRYNIKDAKLLDDIFAYLVNNASNLISINNITNYFRSKNRRVIYDTVANYIQYIENTFLIHRVDRYNIKGKDVVAGNSKYYLNDLSFRNYLYSGFGYGIGYLLENAVFLQLIQADYEVFVGTTRKGEIDFVAKKEARIIYFQVTYLLSDEHTFEREYGAFNQIKDNYEKYVISLDDIQFPSNEGINHIQAWNLCDVV